MVDWGLFAVVLVLLLMIFAAGAGIYRCHHWVSVLTDRCNSLAAVEQSAREAAAGHADILRRLRVLEAGSESVDERFRASNARISTVARELRRALDAEPGETVEEGEPTSALAPFHPLAAPPQPPPQPQPTNNQLPAHFGRRIVKE